MKQEFGLQDYIDLVFKRKWLIIISTVIVLSATVIYTLSRPPVYESRSTFMLETRDIGFSEEGLAITQQTRPLEYYQGVMQSRVFQNRAVQELLKPDEENLEKDATASSVYFDVLKHGLTLNSSEYSDFIQLIVRANSPQLVYNVARVSTEVLKIRCQEIDNEELQNTVEYIENKKEISRKELEQCERALQEYKEEHNVAVTDDGSGLMDELIGYENELTKIQTEKQLGIANLEAYNRRIAQIQGIEEISNANERAPEVNQILDEIQNLEDEKLNLIAIHGEESQEVETISDQIETKRRNMVSKLLTANNEDDALIQYGDLSIWNNVQERKITEELNVFALENKEKYYQRLIANFKSKHPQIMTQAMELMNLTRARAVAENLYNFLVQKGEESKIKAATGTGGIRVIDEAILPKDPVPSNTIRNIVMGFIIGLSLGFGLAYFKEYTDDSIRTQEDVTALLNLPVMGIIPNLASADGMGLKFAFLNSARKQLKSPDDSGSNGQKQNGSLLISQMKSKNPVVESYRSLRSNLQFANMDHAMNTMIISSANPSEGKTITTANLGIVFALLGKKVIIVDTDLRKPKQHKLFGVNRTPGITDVLVEGLDINEVAHNTGIENLRLIPCGKTPPNPAEILASQKMTDVIEEISKHADFILYDSPPLTAVTDPVLLASKLDGILLVVKHRSTNRSLATNIVDQLRKAKVNIVGVVLNHTLVSRGYGYYRYYSKYYQ